MERITTATSTRHFLISSETILKQPVINPVGESLGDITEIILDMSSGQVAYLVLSFGGFLGMGTKLFPIPWSAFRTAPAGDSLVLNVNKAKLENAPGFDKDHRPDMADPEWAMGVSTHYDSQIRG
jgi:sporulation protein YlmC with PRC-barrel domain